jgi:N-dimethylarginine dimethylaminohydrolase
VGSIVSSHNDWDPLEECFVGVADNARIPTVDKSTHSFLFTTEKYQTIKDIEGPIDQKIINEANDDLDRFAGTLRQLGVKVRRPSVLDHSKTFRTTQWQSSGFQTYSCRDLLLPLDNVIIDCPSPMRSRYFETEAYRDFLYEVMANGTEWISAPKPKLLDESFQIEDLSEPSTRNLEIVFDAPNIVRLGNDLLYQVSNSGNTFGAKWLETILKPRGYRIHVAEKFYSFAHFDSTVIPLRPGLVLFNGARLNENWYPPIFKNWDKIFFPKEHIVDIGCELPNNITATSPYIGLNLLSVNEKLVICDINQHHLRKELDRWGIESIGLPMRHAKALAGGFHCVSLDFKRKGNRENYF